jgi:outer membrane protein OmpA-like peptidoglycan-associated protein
LETFKLVNDDYYTQGDGTIGVVTEEYKRSLTSDPLRISPGLAFLTPIGVTFTAGFDISLARKDGIYYGNQSTVWLNDNLGKEPDERKNDQAVIFETGVEPKLAFSASIGWNGLTIKRQTVIPNAPIVEPEPSCDTVRIIDTVYVQKYDTVQVEVEKAPKPVPTYTITASVAAGQGTISPIGVNPVKEGSMAIYSFNPADGYSIEQITVNGQNQGALSQYTFASVMSNQIITVSFKQDPVTIVEVIEVPAPAPVAIEIPREGLVLRGVNFQSGKAILTPSSYDALDKVYSSLREWPEVKLEIQGHTDNVGKPDANLKLSQQRANTVMKYFLEKGVPNDRLKAVGYGMERPIEDNSTPAGREANRRVELKRFD